MWECGFLIVLFPVDGIPVSRVAASYATMPDPLNYFLIFWTFWSVFLFFSVFPMVSPLYSYIIFHLIHCLPVFIMLNIFAWILCVIHNFIVCFLVVSTYQESLQSVYSSILESPCEGNVVEQHRCWSSPFGAGVLYGQWFVSQMLQIRSRTLLLAWDLREMSLGPVLMWVTRKKLLAPSFGPYQLLCFQLFGGINQQMKGVSLYLSSCHSLSLSNSDIRVKNKFGVKK